MHHCTVYVSRYFFWIFEIHNFKWFVELKLRGELSLILLTSAEGGEENPSIISCKYVPNFKRDTGRLDAFKITCDFDIMVVLHSSIFVFSFASVYVFSPLPLADPIAEIKSGSFIKYKCILYNICNSKRGPSKYHKIVKSHHLLLQKRVSSQR